jgi:hypothetical protein
MDEDGYELALEADDRDRIVISDIKTTDEPFTSEPHQKGWSEQRYFAALIGKSARAAQGAYEYTRPHGNSGGLGHRVDGLEPKGDE